MCGVCGYPFLSFLIFEKYICEKFEFTWKSGPGLSNTHYSTVFEVYPVQLAFHEVIVIIIVVIIIPLFQVDNLQWNIMLK